MAGTFRENLVFVAGATPQIITETIYALSQQDPPVYPDDIVIITTATGKRVIVDALIRRGKLQELVSEYDLPPVTFTEQSIIVISDGDGSELDDIRGLAANEAAGDQIAAVIQSLAADPATRLHCSLAGGRKTMSFYLGAALQLFGRKWDRLYHVLITPSFETNPQIFFKPREPRFIECQNPDGSRATLNTAEARIELAELPFLRLRETLNVSGQSFAMLVQQGQIGIDTAALIPDLRVDLAERAVIVGSNLIELLPMQLTIYLFVLRQKLENCKYPEREYCADCTGSYIATGELLSRPALEEMARDYARIHGSRDKGDELLEKWPSGIEAELLRQNVSKLNRSIRESLADETVAAYYLVKPGSRRWGGSRYGIRLDKGKIRLS